MGRRTSLAALAGDTVEDVPGTSDLTLLHVPLSKLVATRFNPRRNFGTKEQLLEFGLVLKKRQLQPAVVVSRSAYLKLWPDEAESTSDATYVIANGERRYRASKAADLGGLWVVHREEVASSKADFLDAVLSENNDRDDLDPIERALGMETMVKELGGAGAVAKHYGKSGGWVSQQRKLLKLVPDLQALVSSGEMPQREGYRIAGLPADEQVGEWQAELRRRKEDEDRRKAAKALPQPRKKSAEQGAVAPQGSSSGQGFSALNGEGATAGGPGGAPDSPAQGAEEFSALKNSDAPSPGSTPNASSASAVAGDASSAAASPDADVAPTDDAVVVAEQGERGALPEVPVKWMPFHSWSDVLRILRARMTPAEFERLLKEGQKLI